MALFTVVYLAILLALVVLHQRAVVVVAVVERPTPLLLAAALEVVREVYRAELVRLELLVKVLMALLDHQVIQEAVVVLVRLETLTA